MSRLRGGLSVPLRREKVIWGSSIFQGEPVFFKKRTYQREGYVSVALEVSLAQQRSVRDYCKRRAAAGVRFDRTGMYFAYLPVQLWTSEVRCSVS